MGIDRKQADAGAEMLAASGLLARANVQTASNLIYEFLGSDYIPKNTAGCPQADNFQAVRKDLANLRKAPPWCRCGAVTGSDVQSGPFYCGMPAEVIAESVTTTCSPKRAGAIA